MFNFFPQEFNKNSQLPLQTKPGNECDSSLYGKQAKHLLPIS
jgi:hypothetical protein